MHICMLCVVIFILVVGLGKSVGLYIDRDCLYYFAELANVGLDE